MAKMNGAQMMVKALEDEGVSTLFGIPGGTVIHLYDALYDSKLNHILMRPSRRPRTPRTATRARAGGPASASRHPAPAPRIFLPE